MYSDRSRKRPVKDRLGADGQNGDEQHRSKRFQGSDGKWRHDMYDIDRSRQTVKDERIVTQDLRHKLQKNVARGTQQSTSDKQSGIKDLREKLSGTMPAPRTHNPMVSMPQQHSSSSALKATSSAVTAAPVSRVPAPIAKSAVPSIKPVAPLVKSSPPVKPAAPAVKPSSSSKVSNGMQGMTISAFLQSLDLSKYLITFQAEEIDMPILRVMKEEELKELGIPMGPRKKIALALAAQKC